MFKPNFDFVVKLGIVLIAGIIVTVGCSNSISQAANEPVIQNTRETVSNEDFDRLVTKNAFGIYELKQPVSNDVLNILKTPTEHDIIVEMHEMTNNYIIAKDVRGKRKMTQERLNALVLYLLSVQKPDDYPHKAHLLDMLSLWKQGEFFMLANDHNYLWTALNGEIGYATGVKDKKDLPAWTTDN